MFYGVLGTDEDVVDVYPLKNLQPVLKHIFDHTLECRWGIAKYKRHNNSFTGAKLRIEGRFLNVIIVYIDLVKPRYHFNLGIHSGIA